MADAEAISRVPWCEEAEAAFRSHPDTAEDLDNIRRNVQEDNAQLWRFTGPASMWLVTRVERYPSGQRELVLVNAIGKNSRLVLDVCDRMAEKIGAQSIRAHLVSTPLMRILEARGWQRHRVVMKKVIADV